MTPRERSLARRPAARSPATTRSAGTVRAPSRAGRESSEFYALDQHVCRIVRVDSLGRVTKSYPIVAGGYGGMLDAKLLQPLLAKVWLSQPEPEYPAGLTEKAVRLEKPVQFRVDEKNRRFVYLLKSGDLVCRGFDGVDLWKLQQPGILAFDLAGDGTLRLVTRDRPELVRFYSRDGRPVLDMNVAFDLGGRGAAVTELRIKETAPAALVVRTNSPVEHFRVLDPATGALLKDSAGSDAIVLMDHERVSVTYPSRIWTAGSTIEFRIVHDARGVRAKVKPCVSLNAWIRPLGTAEFVALPVTGEGDTAHVSVPADYSGLYQVRVGSGVGGSPSLYQLDSVVEVRPADAVGSISLFTPLGRMGFAKGETIPFSVVWRAKPKTASPGMVKVELIDASGAGCYAQTLNLASVKADEPAVAEIAASITRELPAGRYRLTVRDGHQARWTVAPQYLDLGQGPPASPPGLKPFCRTTYGDYDTAFVPRETKYFEVPEAAEAAVGLMKCLGYNLEAERIRGGRFDAGLGNDDVERNLRADPTAVFSRKAIIETPFLRTLAGYVRDGIEKRGILLYMDAGLPLGLPFDARTPSRMESDLADATRSLAAYPAMRGWSWAANWWISNRKVPNLVRPATDYDRAAKAAAEHGTWDKILETTSDEWIRTIVDADHRFNRVLDHVANGVPPVEGKDYSAVPEPAGYRHHHPAKLRSAITAPYRQPGVLPPISFAGADEVDLHFQAEQIQWPMISAHLVDFYKRPGKLAWAHSEVFNDDSTGAQILSYLLQQLMRGANGVGQSGGPSGWTALAPLDGRSLGPGKPSVHRRLNAWLRAYGPWLAASRANDPVVIPVSTRMMRLETGWNGVGGPYFTALYEAYNACLRAHRPASFVFSDDAGSDSLKPFSAVLLVGQSVDPDDRLKLALQGAHAAGVPIYRDQATRPELIRDAAGRPIDTIPLATAFNTITDTTMRPIWNNDSICWPYRAAILRQSDILREAWKAAGPRPVAECDNPRGAPHRASCF